MIGKRLAALGVAGVFALTLAACGASTTASSSTSSTSSAMASSSDAMTSSSATAGDSGAMTSGSMTSSMASGSATGASLVGPGCADYAKANASGAASIDGMAAASVAEAASANPLLKTLVAAVTGKLNPKVNLAKDLDSAEFTVFAPVDSAFAKLPAATVATLKTDSALLTKILTYHVVAGQLSPSQVVGTHKTLEGGTVTVTGSGDNLMVDKSTVICGGVKTKNATVYLIDTVLTPPAAAMTSSAMASSAMASGSATGASLVGPGCADYAKANASGAASIDGMAAASVAEAASANPLLKTLVAAVTGQLNSKVNLAKDLDSAEFTVLAPVDSAFAKLPAATVATLKTDNALLTKILTYHVISGQLSPSQIVGTHKTLEGGTVTVAGSGDNLTVDKTTKVICGGVKTKNATVYLIDTVLTPTS